jgi:hypothetical protein
MVFRSPYPTMGFPSMLNVFVLSDFLIYTIGSPTRVRDVWRIDIWMHLMKMTFHITWPGCGYSADTAIVKFLFFGRCGQG